MATFFLLWLIMALLFFMIELAGVSLFFFLSFAVGALIAALSSFCGLELLWQFFVFLGCSAIAFVFMSIIFNPNRYTVVRTNVDMLLGKKGLVKNDIVPGMMGQAKIGNEIWAARSLSTEIIVKGTLVEVARVQGCHVIVKTIKQAEGVEL